MKYLPFIGGIYSTAPGLMLMAKAETPAEKLVFQVDETYPEYLGNKKECRRENIAKYFAQQEFTPATQIAVNKYLAGKLFEEYPQIFCLTQLKEQYQLQNHLTGEILIWQADWLNCTNPEYVSLFDGLSCQVPEDLAICQLSNQTDWLAAIHLCAPNHWAAQDKVGKTFDVVHGPIPGMEKTNHQYFKMLEVLVQKGPFTRFAWGISTDNRLNHHPEPPPGQEPGIWAGRQIQADTKELFLRVERQNMVGLPDVNAFLFTIRTYFYEVKGLEPPEKKALWAAVESMSEESRHYKGLAGKDHILKQWLI